MTKEATPGALGSNDVLGPLYAERDHVAQGNFYTRHVMAMTAEGLHRKSAIAAELAHRDMEIARLRDLLDRRPAMNAGTLEAYVAWTSEVYASDMGRKPAGPGH